MEGREGEGISRGTGCPPCLLSSPFRNVKRRQDGDKEEEAGGGQVTDRDGWEGEAESGESRDRMRDVEGGVY